MENDLAQQKILKQQQFNGNSFITKALSHVWCNQQQTGTAVCTPMALQDAGTALNN